MRNATTLTAPAAPRPCAPWCTEHANGGPDAADQLCLHRVTSPAFGGVLASHSIDDGTTIALYSTHDELTPADAEQLAYALLAMVAATRTGARR